jgi:2-succinyl-6-hydroxy-2,4-cyclohexadiene-1-carboxylate synthase
VRVLLVPGFSQAPATWGAVRAHLPAGLDVEALAVPDGLDFVATAAALGGRGGPGVWVGYSMGGRLALRLACDRPDLVRHLVLVSTSPGIPDAGARADRRAADERLAATVAELGVETFLTRWLDQPLFADLPAPAREARARADETTGARLAHQLRALGPGTMEPLHDRLGGLTVPVTVVAGHGDAKYTAIGRDLAGTLPDARFVGVPGGHALPLVAPADLAAVIAHVATS